MGYIGEMYAMLRVKWMMRQQRLLLQQQKEAAQSCNNDDTSEDLHFCYDVLQSVSRSFALVILQLRQEVRDAVG
ncbi:hypothetical protein LSM04_009124 [Trypanosoma melophagium]|uniref:uncharacterized protein n=1 Tax=Trypanosoma melophagium TaxID=715481 RepID=UPI00351A6C46|nr:hypothetical protein LSM04_009124 [Trypanosoma melophagium]